MSVEEDVNILLCKLCRLISHAVNVMYSFPCSELVSPPVDVVEEKKKKELLAQKAAAAASVNPGLAMPRVCSNG